MIAFIPARSGSKSVPDKNIKDLGGKPLLAWSIEAAQKADIQRIIVNTDSEAYATIAKEFGAEVQMRPDNLGKDDTSMFALLKSEIPKLDYAPEIVILLQPTFVFRKSLYIRTAISYLVNNPEYTSVVSVERVPEKWHPDTVIVNTQIGYRMANGMPIAQRKTRRQDHSDAFVPTGSLYVFRTSNLENGNFYGDKVMLLEGETGININSEQDFRDCEKLLTK